MGWVFRILLIYFLIRGIIALVSLIPLLFGLMWQAVKWLVGLVISLYKWIYKVLPPTVLALNAAWAGTIAAFCLEFILIRVFGLYDSPSASLFVLSVAITATIKYFRSRNPGEDAYSARSDGEFGP